MAATALVTGVAGFIGSHLAERLLEDGWRVLGVDCFTECYATSIKQQNLASVRQHPCFRFIQADLVTADLEPLVEDASAIFHEAGQGGVRTSWGHDFGSYVRNNVLSTQRLLEAVRGKPIRRFVCASSGSIYGDVAQLPVAETTCPRPVSPYGLTKLAGEQLCDLYWTAYGVPTVRLRYFTVYGPRQRPDMAFHKFIRAIMRGGAITIYGDGEQTRDFTFITDILQATVRAVDAPAGSVFNVAGGSRVTVNEVIETLKEVTGRPVQVHKQPNQVGDQLHTWADTTAARAVLGYRPQVRLKDGLAAQAAWWRESLERAT